MKLIILAAGEGTRLRPFTLERPKCMVEFNGKPIIDHILETSNEAGIKDIIVVCGYKEDVLKTHLKNSDIKFVTNHKYDSTNMLSSLFCAEQEMNDDVVISYADIIYTPGILKQLVSDNNDLSVVIDRDWEQLWLLRMEDPLADAETLKINRDGSIIELGKKPKNKAEIEGQYMGLIKIKKDALNKIRTFYHSLDRDVIYDGKTFDNMFMTSFIQLVIDKLMPVKPVFIKGGWIEIDSVQDLENYKKAGIRINE
jgi:choline kinase